MELPSVAVLLPVYNEASTIDKCLESLAAQDYAGPIEILIADGGSSDGTTDRINSWRSRLPALRILENKQRLQSHGLNLAVASTDADIIVRADAHTIYAPDYVRRSLDALEATGAAAAGGPMVPHSETSFGKAVARAFRTRLGIGPAVFHHADKPAQVDTVYLGAMRRSTWIENGGMRTFPSGVAEDADFYYRLRKRGGTVFVDPAIVSSYSPRDTVAGLWRQFYRYGLGKADMFFVNGEFPSWRPLAPLVLVLGLAAAVVLAFLGNPVVLAIGLGAWLFMILIASGFNAPTVLAIAVIHVAYGIGLIRGLLRRPSRVRAMVS